MNLISIILLSIVILAFVMVARSYFRGNHGRKSCCNTGDETGRKSGCEGCRGCGLR